MTKEWMELILELFGLLDQDDENAVTGIFSDATIDQMNKIREKLQDDLIAGRITP